MSLDVQELTEEHDQLTDQREDLQGALEEAVSGMCNVTRQKAHDRLAMFNNANGRRIAQLERLLEADLPAQFYARPDHLYEDHELNEDWARELAGERHDGVDLYDWPFNDINWERAAYALKLDMCEVEFDGETYYYEG